MPYFGVVIEGRSDQIRPGFGHSGASVGFFPGNNLEKMPTKLTTLQADITQLPVDAIVNAANETLLGGGGVDGGK